ncbi:hypothetical protein BYT27DRAFT_7213115 [Phlegmacium glaucopus]|nr:hypothetical protein BYT27DRAFT_7213115 [Phlegmacium glaucopus]
MPTVANPQPPKDKYQTLKEDYRQLQYDLKQTNMHLEGYKQELRRTRTELRNASHYANELHHEKPRWEDHMNGIQNELNNIHQQLDGAKNLSEIHGADLFYAQVFLTKADTLSISEVGEKVIALNEEIFQAAATLGEALIHQHHELPAEDWNVAAAESQQMVGNTISNILITQALKPEPQVNPLLVQVALQVFMVKFCVSKIQSWYPSDVNIEEFLDAIYSEIRSSGQQEGDLLLDLAGRVNPQREDIEHVYNVALGLELGFGLTQVVPSQMVVANYSSRREILLTWREEEGTPIVTLVVLVVSRDGSSNYLGIGYNKGTSTTAV